MHIQHVYIQVVGSQIHGPEHLQMDMRLSKGHVRCGHNQSFINTISVLVAQPVRANDTTNALLAQLVHYWLN